MLHKPNKNIPSSESAISAKNIIYATEKFQVCDSNVQSQFCSKHLTLGGLGPYVSNISRKMSYPVLAIAVESNFILTKHIHTLKEVTAKCVT